MSARVPFKWLPALLFGIMAVCLGYLAYMALLRPSLRHSVARSRLIAFERRINLGVADSDLRGLTTTISESGWMVSWSERKGLQVCAIETPTEIGAQNWVLYVAMESGTVKGAGIRKSDNRRFWPEGAPIDRVDSEIKDAWRELFGVDGCCGGASSGEVARRSG